MFRQVTDMAWDAAGNTYISDGYVNSRIAKVDKDGNWLKSWGEPGSEPGQLNTPHSIAVDAEGKVYVADRGNRRIQVFDGDGKVLRQIVIDVPVDPNARPAIGKKPELPISGNQAMAPGAPWTVCITPPPNQVLYSSDGLPGPDLQAQSGRQSSGRARRVRQAAKTVWLDSRDCLPVGKCALRGRAAELASAEINSGTDSLTASRKLKSVVET